MSFHSHANKTHFHKKGCALGLILKVRAFGTRKRPIKLNIALCRRNIIWNSMQLLAWEGEGGRGLSEIVTEVVTAYLWAVPLRTQLVCNIHLHIQTRRDLCYQIQDVYGLLEVCFFQVQSQRCYRRISAFFCCRVDVGDFPDSRPL